MSSKKRREGDGKSLACADREEIMKLTQMVKSWEFTCSFCFKKFASAQALGGHQNAHRSERLEEKRLFVRDPIGYRKRAYIQALKGLSPDDPAKITFESSPNPETLSLHAAAKVVKHELSNVKGAKKPMFLSSKVEISGDKNMKNVGKMKTCVLMNFLPPKELSLAESVGMHADEFGEKGIQFGDGLTDTEKPDLTLKL